MVDPDNRLPVDFAARQHSLDETMPAELASNWSDGRIKQSTTARILAVRMKTPEVFSDGSYLPLEVAGPLADHVVAFARISRNTIVIATFCRLSALLLAGDGSLSIPVTRWKDTRLVLPPEVRTTFSEALTPKQPLRVEAEVGLEHILNRLPISLLTNIQDDRQAV
jgi:(1->4)-alpha-D-glucan 1-alpha-D-glucosylmutase